MWGIVSHDEEHEGDSKQKPSLFPDDQCLHSASLLYLPDNIRAWTWAMDTDTLAGELPAVVHMGCGLVRDMKFGLKYVREDNSLTSSLSTFSQYEIILFFIMLLN